jgi:hypothetical protein
MTCSFKGDLLRRFRSCREAGLEGGFHRYGRDPWRGHSVRHRQKVASHRLPVSCLLMVLPRRLHPPHVDLDRFLVDVQTSTVSKNLVHDRLPSPRAGGHRKVKQSAPRALAEAGRQLGGRSDAQARLICGLAAPRTTGLRPARAASIII